VSRQLTARPPDASVVCELWLAVSEIPGQPATSLTPNKLCLADPSSTHCAFLSRSLCISQAYRTEVNYDETVERHYKCSTVNWKVVGRSCRRTTSTPTSSLTNVTRTWSHLRTILTPSVCRHVVVTVCRRRREGPDADDTTSTLCRCSSSLSPPPVDARSRFIQSADIALNP